MKKIFSMIALAAIALGSFTSCGDDVITPNPGGNTGQEEQTKLVNLYCSFISFDSIAGNNVSALQSEIKASVEKIIVGSHQEGTAWFTYSVSDDISDDLAAKMSNTKRELYDYVRSLRDTIATEPVFTVNYEVGSGRKSIHPSWLSSLTLKDMARTGTYSGALSRPMLDDQTWVASDTTNAVGIKSITFSMFAKTDMKGWIKSNINFNNESTSYFCHRVGSTIIVYESDKKTTKCYFEIDKTGKIMSYYDKDAKKVSGISLSVN